MKLWNIIRGQHLRLAALLFGLTWLLLTPASLASETTPDLIHNYLEPQFDWAMYLDLQSVPHYLNYYGSQLRPLTRVRVYLRAYPKNSSTPVQASAATLYEEFWYQKGKPIGLRRHEALSIDKGKIGIVIIGTQSGTNDSSQSATNALVRLLLDLQFHGVATSIVQVPDDSLAQIRGDLEHYGFHDSMVNSSGPQFSITLRSNPSGTEECYYFSR